MSCFRQSCEGSFLARHRARMHCFLSRHWRIGALIGKGKHVVGNVLNGRGVNGVLAVFGICPKQIESFKAAAAVGGCTQSTPCTRRSITMTMADMSNGCCIRSCLCYSRLFSLPPPSAQSVSSCVSAAMFSVLSPPFTARPSSSLLSCRCLRYRRLRRRHQCPPAACIEGHAVQRRRLVGLLAVARPAPVASCRLTRRNDGSGS